LPIAGLLSLEISGVLKSLKKVFEKWTFFGGGRVLMLSGMRAKAHGRTKGGIMSNKRKVKNKTATKQNGQVTSKTRPPKIGPKASKKTGVSGGMTPFGKEELPNVMTDYTVLSLLDVPIYITGCGLRVVEGQRFFIVFKLNVTIPSDLEDEDGLVAYLSDFLAGKNCFAHPVPPGTISRATLTSDLSGDLLADGLKEIVDSMPTMTYYGKETYEYNVGHNK